MTTEPTIVGIDLGKNWFHLVGLDGRGATVLRKKLNRAQLAEYAATAPGASWRRNRVRARSTGAGCLRRRAMRSGFCRRNS